MTAAAATQEPGRTNHRHADASLASDSAGSDHGNGQGAAIMALTPATYETIKNQLRFSLSAQGSRAKRNRGAHKRAFLTNVARQAPGYEWLAELCETTQEDVATVAQSVLDKWDGKGEWLAEAVAAMADAADQADTYASIRADFYGA